MAKAIDQTEPSKEAVERLRMALEDVTAMCILEGFSKQDHLMLVDAVLKELGKVEARVIYLDRKPVLTSKHFIQQYYMSFDSDPVLKTIRENPDDLAVNGEAT